MTRDDKGRFKKGETGNPKGRKPREVERRYLDIMLGAVSEKDWQVITERAVSDAKRGDMQAREWLSKYLIGNPEQVLKLKGQVGIGFLWDWERPPQANL